MQACPAACAQHFGRKIPSVNCPVAFDGIFGALVAAATHPQLVFVLTLVVWRLN